MAHADPKQARVVVLTISDTRTEADDKGGALCASLVKAGGHVVVGKDILPDDPDAVRARCTTLCQQDDVDVVLLTGGTGISRRDTTVEAVSSLFSRRLDGFGELFRMLSFQEIGSKSMASRAVAGVSQQTLLFVMPGSIKAVKLAMERLIVPEIGHLVGELAK